MNVTFARALQAANAYGKEKRRETMSYYKKARVQNFPLPFADDTTSGGGGGLGGGLLKSLNWKPLLDQVGGIDGLITRMNQVQKLIHTVQQFAPVMKMLSGAFGRKPLSTTSDEDDESFLPPTRARTGNRRRRGKRRAGKKTARRTRRVY